MYCGNCGKEIEDDAAFCPECGSRVEATQKTKVKGPKWEIKKDSV